MTFKRNAVALCSGLTQCVLAAGLMRTGNTVNAAQPIAPTPPQITVAEVVKREVRAWDTFSARLEAVEQVAVRARAEVRQVMGITVSAGMLAVTLFGLFLTPVFYVLLRALAGNRPLHRQARGGASTFAENHPLGETK